MRDSTSLDDLMLKLLAVTDEAGRILLSHWRSPHLKSRMKSDDSPVTQADLASDALFQKALPQIIPAPVVSEESELPADGPENPGVWFVDPLDGTQSFVAGSDEFAIVAGYAEHGVPLLGVVAAPAKGLVYYAVRGSGAWRKADDRVTALERRVLSPTAPLRIVLSKHPSPGGKMQSAEFIRQAAEHRRSAPEAAASVASALKSGLVADGTYDLVFHPDRVSIWDLCGAQCLYNETGGSLLELKTQTPITFDRARPISVDGYIGFVDGAFPIVSS